MYINQSQTPMKIRICSLFNSISSSLCGNETLATELRLRTAVEMITNAEVYTSRQDYDKIYDYSPSFDKAMLACCDDREFSSIWNLMALANVIDSPVQSLYPRMNSEKDEAHLWLSVLACDENTKDRTRFNILWTHVGPKRKGAWTANHFVPVLRGSIPAASAINETNPQAATNSRASDVNESFAPSVNSTSTPVIGKRKYDFSLTEVDPKSIPSEHNETTVFVADRIPSSSTTQDSKTDFKKENSYAEMQRSSAL